MAIPPIPPPAPRMPHNNRFVIVGFNRPVLWARTLEETWMFNPPRRYILNASQLKNLEPYIESISDLSGSAHYRPLQAGSKIAGARILIERYRERGIGDLLFLTGPLNYMQHMTGGSVMADVYALADRGHALMNHPALRFGKTLAGPVHYDDLALYDYHWFVDTVTEYDEEPDQLNVYDSLYQKLGFDPASIDIRFKRPTLVLDKTDEKNSDQFLFYVYMERKLDLLKTGYYLVAPLANGSLRSGPYGMWLKLIDELARRRPVVVIGNLHERVPETDMQVGDFYSSLNQMGGNVINAMGATPRLRSLMAVISKASCVICLDSGPLYIAQALRRPAVSVWGPHDPMVRIGYDEDYMRLAVWTREACRFSPCFAYDSFPRHKCPLGEEQKVCHVLSLTDHADVIKRADAAEGKNYVLPRVSSGGADA